MLTGGSSGVGGRPALKGKPRESLKQVLEIGKRVRELEKAGLSSVETEMDPVLGCRAMEWGNFSCQIYYPTRPGEGLATFGTWSAEPGRGMGKHSHPKMEEWFCVSSGRVTITSYEGTESVEEILTSGRWIHFPPGVSHSIEALDPSEGVFMEFPAETRF
jgi:quercetin dioxygenase-like cupin family protein